MNALIEGISSTTSVVRGSGYQTNQVSQSGNSEPLLKSSSKNSISSDNVSLTPNDINLASLQAEHDQLHVIARDIRETNKVLGQVSKVIGEAHEEVIQYEKQYPPFQNQSSEKVEFLNSIASFKRQIDALTLVPDNKELGSQVSDIKENKHQLSGSEELEFPIPGQEISREEYGLNIASFSSNASDREIRQFGKDLALASQKLDNKKEELIENTKTIFNEIGSNEKLLGSNINLNEREATQKSEDIKEVLTALSRESLGNEQRQNRLELLR